MLGKIKSDIFIFSLHCFLIIILLIFLIFQEEGIFVVLFSIIFACIELYLWAWREKKIGHLNWCHPIPVFTLGYCIVFYQLPFCYLAGYDLSYYSYYVLFAPQNISYCVLLAASGLAAFFAGEQFFFLKTRKSNIRYDVNKDRNQNLRIYFERIKIVTKIILVLTISFFLLYIKSFGSLDNFWGFAYGDKTKYIAPFSNYYNLVYRILLYLAILLQIARIVHIRIDSIRSYVSAWDKMVLAVIAITLVPFFLSGDRGSFLLPLALVISPYFLIAKPLRFQSAAVIVVSMAFFLSVVGDIRGNASNTWKEAIKFRIEAVSNPAQWPTIELANSFGTFNIATNYFPQTYPYNYGFNILCRFSSLVPFLPRISGIEKLNLKNDYIYSSSLFFTNILTRGTFSSGSGTSSLAEIYMDFGPYGIPVAMFLWGVFMAWISQRAVKTLSAVFVFLYAYYAYFGIYVNRSSFLFNWNILIWVIFLFYFLRRLYLAKSKIN